VNPVAVGDLAQAQPAITGRGPSPLKSARILAILVFVAVAAVLLGGFRANLFAQTYDGWTVGAVDSCPEPDFDPAMGENQPSAWDCEATLALWLSRAREAFDRRDPDHAPVVRASLHYNGSNKTFLSTPLEVALFELTDRTVRAIGVGHFGVDYAHISTGDYGPDR